MTRLPHKDFDALQRAILELYGYRLTRDFAEAVPGIFLKIISADFFA